MSRNVLKNPPRLIDPSQRIKYGAVHGIVGMAECAYRDLRLLLADVAENDCDKERDELKDHRAMMLAWSIVDQADLLRHLITSESKNIDLREKGQFLAVVRPVTQVRNWMRHIPQRVMAYRDQKERMPPVLGALSFVKLVRASVPFTDGQTIDGDNCIEYHTIIMTNTPMERSAKLEGEPIPYTQFRAPIDHIVLQAFGSNIPIDEVVSGMSLFASALARAVERWLEQKLQELKSEGRDVDTISQPAFESGNYRMVAKRD